MTGKPCWYLLILILICFFCIVPAIADTSTDYWAPWVTKTNTTSATINWRQEISGTGTIEYANASYYNQHQGFDKTITDAEVTQYHHVLLTGLDPNTPYKYWVQPLGHEDVFNNRTFRTMPVSGPFTFIVISDSHAEEKRFKYVADALTNEKDILFVLDGGDYAGYDYESYWSIYFQDADGILANSSLFTTIGNHEYHNFTSADGPPTAADQYHWAFDTPLNYSFDCANVRYVVLDSPDPNNANGDDPHTSLTLAESQASWLRDQLDNTMAGTFVIDHHPIWDYNSTTSNPDLQPWETLFHTYNISADFAGHTHDYQRYSVEGIPYFIVGDAGGKMANISSGDPHPVWYVFGETLKLGYLKVTVDPANNTATAQQIFVASIADWDSETATVIDPPVIADTITFSLSTKLPTPTPNSGGSSTDPADSGRTSSYAATSSGSYAGHTMTFAINQPITPNAPGAFISVAVVPSTNLGSTEMTVADANTIDKTQLNGRQTAYLASIELVGVNPSSISQGTITFAVAGSWLTQNGVSPDNIVLMRDHDGQWSELPTMFEYQTGDTDYFTATTP